MRSREERSSAEYHQFYYDTYRKYAPIKLDDPETKERIPQPLLVMLLTEPPIIDVYAQSGKVTPRPNLEELMARHRRGERTTAWDRDNKLNAYYHRLLEEGPSARDTNPEELTPKERLRVEKLYHSRKPNTPTLPKRPLYELD